MLTIFMGLLVLCALPVLSLASPAKRAQVQQHLGDIKFRIISDLMTTAGGALVLFGYYSVGEDPTQLYEPSLFMRTVSSVPEALGYVSLAAAVTLGHLRQILRRPLVVGVALIAISGLLASGRTGTVAVCGTLLLAALLYAANQRLYGQPDTFEPALREDMLAVAIGLSLFGLATFGYVDTLIALLIGGAIGVSTILWAVAIAGERK